MISTLAALGSALVLAGPAPTPKVAIQGDYIEARTADIYTGPCFSNSEVFIVGDKAVLAWKVNRGAFAGVDLSGLSVAAAIKGSTTFSEDQPERARSVVIVDEKADARQREALVALAKHLAGERLARVAAVKAAPIVLTVESHAAAESKACKMPQAPRGSLWVPGLASILTRPLEDTDHVCGNEVVAYEPLSQGVQALPAYTLGHAFRGRGLDTTWDDPHARSSFVGHFSY